MRKSVAFIYTDYSNVMDRISGAQKLTWRNDGVYA